MLISKRWALCIIFSVFGLSSYVVNANDDVPQGLAVQILSQLQNSEQVNYVNAESWLIDKNHSINKNVTSSLTQIKTKVLKYNKPTLVDFSSVTDESEKEKAKELFRKQIGISFPDDLLIMTKHKGELMFSPIAGDDDPSIALLESNTNKVNDVDLGDKIGESLSNYEHRFMPHLSFYLRVNRNITPEECTFKRSTLWKEFGDRVFCSNSNISLIYRINLKRSLAFDVKGNETPNVKLVRISLDDDSSGAGIHLNDELSHQKSLVPYFVLIGNTAEWSTSAIAQDYSFSFNASNDKPAILKTVPSHSLDAGYEKQEISGVTVGVTVGADPDMRGPKIKSEVSDTYTQTRSLTFNTQDYRVEKNTTGSKNVSFKWIRQNNSTAGSLLNRYSDAIWNTIYPVDLTRIKPMSYQNFVPKMDVVYEASPYTVGSTDFSISSSVNIRPLYHKAYQYFYFIGAHHEYSGIENSKRKRVEQVSRFTVDWEHPVFLGNRLVDIQLGGFNDRCIDVVDDGSISTQHACDEENIAQSFVYDKYGRYVSALDSKLCLDGSDLSKLKACNMSLSQRWEWKDYSDKLSNLHNGKFLGHNIKTGQLRLYDHAIENVSLRMLTSYTNFLKSASDKKKSHLINQ
ncbi:leukocidin family pore-forming toxin [Photobacterium leiognathi]|uniref:leukocidin family pore-forming toxin n=1 Tax=Photobacterium leiognathi TaxID=553611 RepID=UPI0027322C12|nr:leukocidin family pore-forming toxin [Photobacterium leiognathi]